MTASPRCRLPARMASLGPARDFVEAFCAAQGVDDDDRLRLALFVEELLTNTVTHGYRGDADAPVELRLESEPGELRLHYADSAPAFDPLAHAERAREALHGALDERPLGQIGIPLLLAMASRAEYRHADGMNRLTLALPRQG